MNTPAPTEVDCPTCLATVPWTEDNPHRPFCSERCKLIDFGNWATERNVIPGEPLDDKPDPPFRTPK